MRQYVNPDADNNPIRTVPGRPSREGGEYQPFGEQPKVTTLDGGGGGGVRGGVKPPLPTYVPPVKPNPTFVPPKYVEDGKIKITLSADQDVQFLENGTSVGNGKTITLEKKSLAFGSEKTYRAIKTGRESINYFVVSIEKKFNTILDLETNKSLTLGLPPIKPSNPILPTILDKTIINPKNNTSIADGALSFGFNKTKPIELNDYLYAENISIKEFQLSLKTKEFVFLKETKLQKTTGNVTLNFLFNEIVTPAPPRPIPLDYEIQFISNFASSLGNTLSLKHEIVLPSGQVVNSDTLPLAKFTSGNKKIDFNSVKDGKINFKILGNLPPEYSYKIVYYKNIKASSLIANDSAVGWKEVDDDFSVPAKELQSGGIVVNAIFDRKVKPAVKPQLILTSPQIDKQVKDSDKDSILNIPFKHTNADFVDVYINDTNTFRVNAKDGYVTLSFVKNFSRVFGKKKIILVPFSDLYGSGDRYELIINFTAINDFPSITQIIFPTDIEIPSFSDGNIEWEVSYDSFAASSIDVDLYTKGKNRVSLFKNLPKKGTFKINLRELATKFPQWNGSNTLILVYKPYNRSGETQLVGNEYEATTVITYPTIKLDENIIRKSIYDAFEEHINFTEPEKEVKNLTHLLNLGNDNRVLISSWEEDNWTLSEKEQDSSGNTIIKNEINSVILKLYDPLPDDVTLNSTMWITKLMTNPLIETVVLNERFVDDYPYLQGPNFDVEVDFVKGQSTNYESLDNLIISASSSSTLIQNYLSASLLDTTDLNVQYVSGSIESGSVQYIWDNFVHFSSAAERVNNFVYKIQLIEGYETSIVSSSIGPQTGSLSAQQEVQRLNAKKSSLIQGFDGFETFLYTSSSYTTNTSGSITWPHNAGVRMLSTNQNVVKWYENVLTIANRYDVNNTNYLLNNIPQYIKINPENENYLLFFSMIGHHFDNIYYYTKAIERSRGLGYQSSNEIANKLLYESLKSFGWDAKNLSSDRDLWNYVFGEDKAGNQKQSTPSKERSKEVWRRVINNLPYLLKHKGTRRGIYALMACYGIPSSNLSIMEFGGPEVTDDTKNKLLLDGTSYAVKMGESTGIEIDASGVKSVEVFIKPAYAQNKIVFEDPSIKQLYISGSVGSKYGKVMWGNQLTTSLLPIFNDRYLGICLSDWGSYRRLDVMQTDGDREIFYQSVTSSVETFSGTGTIIIGQLNADGFSGSLDEIRLWNQPLSSSVFKQHVYYPEMINGNHTSSSTTDLEFRLDFEYPKNLATKTKLLNVAPGIKLNSTSSRNYYEDNGVTTGLSRLRTTMPLTASAGSFTSVTTHPYQFEVINRNFVLEMPDIGVSRYATNKVRFEEQALLSDLSSKHRATRKAFDNQPIDSNRVGLFFSPNKELNLDIAKSFGDTNFNEYIGDPSDRFKPGYKSLDNIREYYFQRVQHRDIYSYINLIRAYEKVMFEDIKKMLPARVTATTGILVEPHFLERSKYQYTKPTGSNDYYEGSTEYDIEIQSQTSQYDALIDADMSEQVFGENHQYQSTIDADFSENVFGENHQYEGIVYTNDEIQTTGEYYMYDANVVSDLYLSTKTKQTLNDDTNKLLGSNDFVDIGFSVYAQSGSAIRTYYNNEGILQKERIRLSLVEEEKTKTITRQSVRIQSGNNRYEDPRSEPVEETITYRETKLVIQPFTASVPVVGSVIKSVTPVDGYLPTHYRYTTDLTTGMQNAYFRGSKNTSATTLDGSEPIEVFVTNPNVIRIVGRDNNEPIIEVD